MMKNKSGTIYAAFVVSQTDYLAYGQAMPDRSFNTTVIRYTFNGKEDEIFSDRQDYGFRNYDKRQRRFTSVDPLTAKYTWNSPYSFAENDVIRCFDLDGLEKIMSITWYNDSYAEVLVEVEDGNGYTHVENAVNQKMAYWGLSTDWQSIRNDNPKTNPERPSGMDTANYNDATGEFHQLYEKNGNLKLGAPTLTNKLFCQIKNTRGFNVSVQQNFEAMFSRVMFARCEVAK
jgi:RHS repeat-associated protein